MNNVVFAAFLGGWEVLVILVVLLACLLLAAISGFLIFLVVRSSRQKQVPAGPVVPKTQVLSRKCPQCGAELKPDAPEGLCPACLLQRGIATEGGAPPGTPPFVPPTIPDLARLFPQLEILELIGKGGMGAVYKARQPALDRFVALKILAPRSGSDLDFASRFTREARALARLSHPNIVGVYDFGVAAGQRPDAASLNYFIMEYVDGPNLRQVESAGKLSPREALEIIPQICAALQFAHDEGIVHRDIKPENVLIDKKGRVKIADFGLAKILGQEPKDFRLTGAREVMGTPHYMAPEQVEKPQEVDHRADIYSLGVVFYEMLTGELPLGKFSPPSQRVQVDVRLDEVVMRSLEKEPQRRYQHVSEVKTQVETIASSPEAGSRRREEAPFKSQTRLAPTATASPLRRGMRAGLWVFLLIVAATVIVTLLLPRDYVGIARVRLTGPEPPDPYHLQTETEVIQSQAVLKPVAASLKLGQRWAGKFSGGEVLGDDQTLVLMKRMIELRPVRNTALIEIRFHSDLPVEAVEIANEIARTYCARPPGHAGDIVEWATARRDPDRPNIPLNIFLGVLAGLALGTFTGVAVGLFSYWRRRKQSPSSAGKPDHFWRWFAIGLVCLALIPVAIAILGLLAAIAIPNFVRARGNAQHEQAIVASSIARQNEEAQRRLVERSLTGRRLVERMSRDPAIVIPGGLVSWWSAEGNADDTAGNNDGRLEGGAGFGRGKFGQAFLFDATNADVRIPASSSLNVGLGEGFTLAAWINPSDVSAYGPLFEWNTGDGKTYWGVHFYIDPFSFNAGPGTLYANVVDNQGHWHQIHSAAGVVTTGRFQPVALTYDKTSGAAKIYCNGTVVAEQNLGSFTPLTTYDLYLGRRPPTVGESCTYIGLMDEAGIYNRALSANEILAINNAGRAGKPETMVFFDEARMKSTGGSAGETKINLVVNGSFETPQVPLASESSWWQVPPGALAPWHTTEPYFELWTNGYVATKIEAFGTKSYAPCYSAAGEQNLELIPDDVFEAAIWQTVPTVAGKRYTLSFYHTPRPGMHSTLTVSVNAQLTRKFDEDGTGLTSFEWKKASLTFTADSDSTTLKFSDKSSTLGAGAHLDDVKLVPHSTTW